jgi:hypothetical protein
MERLALWEFVRENVEGGLLYWEPGKLRKTCQGRLWKWSISFSVYRLREGNLEEGFLD